MERSTVANADGGAPAGELEDAWASFRAQYRMESDVSYEKLVAEVVSGRGAPLDSVGRLVRAEMHVEVVPLVEA